MKGSQPAGQTQSQQYNPATPFLAGGYQAAQNLYNNNPINYYPGQSLATAGQPEQLGGYQNLYNQGANFQAGIAQPTTDAYGRLIGGAGDVQNSPAYGGYQAYAGGTAYPQTLQQQIAQAAASQGPQYAAQIGQYGAPLQNIGNQGQAYGAQYGQQVGQYAAPLQGIGNQGQAYGSQYGQQVGQYSQPLQNIGNAAQGMGNQYAAQMGGLADPAAAYAREAGANNNAALNSLMSISGGQGVGMEQLARAAQGNYLNANPYLDANIQAAQRPVTENYLRAVAPQIAAQASSAGRYGSGAQLGVESTAQHNLAQGLGDISTRMRDTNYQAERARQDAAAGQYTQLGTTAGQYGGQLYNQGLGLGISGLRDAAGILQGAGSLGLSAADRALAGNKAAADVQATAGGLALSGIDRGLAGNTAAANAAQAAGGLALSGVDRGLAGNTQASAAQANAASNYYRGLEAQSQAARDLASSQQYGLTGLQGGFQAGNTAAINAMQQFPNISAAQFTGPRAQVEGGAGVRSLEQQQIDDAMRRFYGEQQAPYNTLDQYMKSFGGVGPGSTTQTPYFQNQGANVLSGLTGAAGLGNQLGLFGGLGGLGGAGAGSALAGISSGALPAVIAPGISSAGLGSLAAMNAGTSIAPALAAAAAPAAAWIVCTELMRQGRMPKKHWAVGLKAFERYPEIVKQGYYVWAIPSVKHLRANPGSRYSRFLATVFGWRAEDIAARTGLHGARKLWRGRVVTASLALPCLALGLVAGKQNWRQVYQEQST